MSGADRQSRACGRLRVDCLIHVTWEDMSLMEEIVGVQAPGYMRGHRDRLDTEVAQRHSISRYHSRGGRLRLAHTTPPRTGSPPPMELILGGAETSLFIIRNGGHTVNNGGCCSPHRPPLTVYTTAYRRISAVRTPYLINDMSEPYPSYQPAKNRS